MKPKKYACPECGNDDAKFIAAEQLCRIPMRVGEYEDGTHHLVDAELGDEYVGPVRLVCELCIHTWRQKEIKL